MTQLATSPNTTTVAEPSVTLLSPAVPRWSLASRILFRFVFIYFLLYAIPYPWSFLPYGEQLFWPHTAIWNWAVPWVGEHVFDVKITVLPNGSGDTTYNYVQVFCFLMLAGIGTLIWSLLDRKRGNYARVYQWMSAYLRFSLALTMVLYGAAKVIKSQFPGPSPDRLIQPFGDASPMGLLWTFMGASELYNWFTGSGELLAGLLLTARRTTLLGTLACVGVVSHVLVLNLSYDVPVKLFSLHLLLMAFVVMAPFLSRLGRFFFTSSGLEPLPLHRLFQNRWLHYGILSLRTVAVWGFVAMTLYTSYQGRKTYGDLAPRPPFYGVWNVDEYELDAEVRPPLLTDGPRWRRLTFSYPGMISIQLMSDVRERFRLELDSEKRTLELTKFNGPAQKSSFSYQQPEPEVLALSGTMDGHKIRAKLRRMEESNFFLLNRGFHWINEYPFNR